MKIELSRQIFEKHSNIKFRENPFSGSRVPRRERERERRTNERTGVMKLTALFAILRTSLNTIYWSNTYTNHYKGAKEETNTCVYVTVAVIFLFTFKFYCKCQYNYSHVYCAHTHTHTHLLLL